MTVELNEKDHIVCIWQADDLDGNNFLMLLRKRDGCYLIDYRFRYRRDEKVFDSKDEKSFYNCVCKPETTETEVFEACKHVFLLISERYCIHSFCQRVDGDLAKFEAVLKKYECFHIKTMPLEGKKDSVLPG